MKKISLFISLICLLLTSGCLGSDTMDNIEIYTTSYPIEFVTSRLYGKHSIIKSIYPDGMDKGYVVNDKLLSDYSSTDLFIFNGLMEYTELDSEGNVVLDDTGNSNIVSEKDYIYTMLDNNKKLKIIDVSTSISYDSSVLELWLDPMNLLTVANNIKKGFNQYITSAYLLDEISANYQSLKEELVKLDADYRYASNRATNHTIVVGNDALLYLEKYDIDVISLEENNSLTQKTIHDVSSLINNGTVKYIYVLKDEAVNDTIASLVEDSNVKVITLHDLNNITEEERDMEKTYFTIMYENLELLKEQLYN